MSRKVAVTGAGVISPLGNSRSQFFNALCDGTTGLRSVQRFPTPGLDRPLAGEIVDFTPKAILGERNFRPLDGPSQLLASAAQLALDDSGWSAEMLADSQVGLVAGTVFSGAHTISQFDRRAVTEGPKYASALDFANTVINAAAGQTAIWHNLRGVNSTIAAGATSGLQSIAYATELIRSGQATAILAGGVDELSYESLIGFCRAGMSCNSNAPRPVPFDKQRNGFAPAEGAALLMLEDADSAARRGATIIAEIKGHGSAFDLKANVGGSNGKKLNRSAGSIGRAIHLAMADAKLGYEHLDAISASANGSPDADRREAVAIEATFNGSLAAKPITAVKSMVGETLGASGGLQTVAAIQAIHSGRWPGIAGLQDAEAEIPVGSVTESCRDVPLKNVLVNSVGWDGNCAALVVARFE